MKTMIIISLILIGITVLSIAIEPRRMRNAIYVAITFLWLSLFALGLIVVHMGSASVKTVLVIFSVIPILYFALAVFLIINGFILIKKEGKSKAAMLCPVFGVCMIIGALIVLLGYGGPLKFLPIWIPLITFEISFYVFVSLFCYLLYSLLYSILPKRPKCDYIIIHGAGLMSDGTPTPLLKKRIDKAVELWHKCGEKPMLIPSGGQGADEIISEAESMARYLNENGVDMTKVMLEDKSTTTFENLGRVKDIVDAREHGHKYRCIFVTSNYHVLRTAFYSKKINLNAQGVGCRTAGYYLPSAFLREYAALMVYLKWVAILYAAFCALMLIGVL